MADFPLPEMQQEHARQMRGGFDPAAQFARPTQEIPVMSWERVLAWLDERWYPGMHVSIFGVTGSGKTYVVVHGLLPLWTRSRVLIIDVKYDRGTMAGTGRIVKATPRWHERLPFRVREWTHARDHQSWDRDPEWFKLQPPDYTWTGDRRQYQKRVSKVRDLVGDALQTVFNEGDWVLVLDEVQTVSSPRQPGLDLEGLLTRVWREGRDRNVTVIAGTQAPAGAPSAMYDQASFLMLGRMTDVRRQLRLGEIGGNRQLIVDVLPQLDKKGHEFLVMDLIDEEELVTRVAAA